MDRVGIPVVDARWRRSPLIRCSEFGSNDKLARRLATAEELAVNPDDKIKVIAETRGEGGFTVEPPSHGKVHPSGRPYVLERGSLATIRSVTPDQRAQFLGLIRTFDELPRATSAAHAVDQRPPSRWCGSRPVVRHRDGEWRRQSERDRGLQRTDDLGGVAPPGRMASPYQRRRRLLEETREIRNRATRRRRTSGARTASACSRRRPKFKVTDPGGGSKAGHDRFGFYAVEYHGGDQKAAARELFARGYGARDRRNGHAASGIGADGGRPTGGRRRLLRHQPRPWGEPARVLGLPAAPALDLALFPPEIANVALDASERLQAPPDYLAWGLVATVAGLIGRRRRHPPAAV